MNSASRKAFDFDQWSALARSNPDEFERRRRQLIETVLAEAPGHMQNRLRGLQFRIDMERAKAGTPLGAAIRLNAMMWSSFNEMRSSLSALVDGTAVPAPPLREATLLQFPRRT